MSFTRAQAQFVAHTILAPSALEDGTPAEGLEWPTSGDTERALSTEWKAKFVEMVMPSIRRGYKYITETADHKIELVGFAKIMVDEFSEQNIDTIAAILATPDLTWGRLVAFFTLLSFAAADLAAKDRQSDLETLKEWLINYLCSLTIRGEFVSGHSKKYSLKKYSCFTQINTTSDSRQAGGWLSWLKSFFWGYSNMPVRNIHAHRTLLSTTETREMMKGQCRELGRGKW